MEVVNKIWSFLVGLWEYELIRAMTAGGLLWLLGKAIGRSNKSINWLRITYKAGIEKIVVACMDSEYYFKLTVLRAVVFMFSVLVFLMMAIKGSGLKVFDSIILLSILLGAFALFRYVVVIKKVYLRKHFEHLRDKEKVSEEEEWK